MQAIDKLLSRAKAIKVTDKDKLPRVVLTLMLIMRTDGKAVATCVSGDGSTKPLEDIYKLFLVDMKNMGHTMTDDMREPLVYREDPRQLLMDYLTIITFKNGYMSRPHMRERLIWAVRRLLEFRFSIHKVLLEEREVDPTVSMLEFKYPLSEFL